MGCVSSKHLKKNLKHEVLLFGNNNVDLPNHVVNLTSSTYGLLNLDHAKNLVSHNNAGVQQQPVFLPLDSKKANSVSVSVSVSPKGCCKDGEDSKKAVPVSVSPKGCCKGGEEGKKAVPVSVSPKGCCKGELEVINTWELMSDLEDEVASSSRTPFKRLSNHVISPKEVKRLDGKENKNQCYNTPKGRVFRPWKSTMNSTDKLRKGASLESPRRSNSGVLSSSSRRRSLGPLFDPALIDSFEKELSQEKEDIKKMVSHKGCNSLEKYEEKCPNGGENCVVIYTTTLRGIRKTFEECNVVRSVIESYHIRLIERDISMDSGFKEELRKLMGRKEVKVPLVFVKGRLIGGANEVVKLDEDGRLEEMLQGISKGVFGCQGCGGIRFVMCMDCNGSCKVLDEHQRSMVRCGECNENGLIQCPICCSDN